MEITSGKIVGAQKTVVYGPEGIGKSTFASRFPNPVFIDTEGSTKHMDVPRTPKPSSWTMLLEQVRYFKANPYLYDTLVIDTADWAEQLCMTEICAKSQKKSIEDFGYGKGYIYLAEEFGRLLNLLEDIIEVGMNVVITAHAQMRKFEQPEEMGAYDRWELKLQKKTAPLLKEWADMVLFANYEIYVINVDNQGVQKGKNKAQGGKRVMYTTHTPSWDAKNRHSLDLKLNFDYKEIAHCIVTKEGIRQPSNEIQEPPETPKEVQQSKLIAEENKYYYHPESESSFKIAKGEEIPIGSMDFELSHEITKEEYEIKNKQPKDEPNKKEPPKNDLEGVPKPLADLMVPNNVTVEEIQQVVAGRGYYPPDTPIDNYDPNFISGVLVGAWGQVYKMIEDLRRNSENIPF